MRYIWVIRMVTRSSGSDGFMNVLKKLPRVKQCQVFWPDFIHALSKIHLQISQFTEQSDCVSIRVFSLNWLVHVIWDVSTAAAASLMINKKYLEAGDPGHDGTDDDGSSPPSKHFSTFPPAVSVETELWWDIDYQHFCARNARLQS